MLTKLPDTTPEVKISPLQSRRKWLKRVGIGTGAVLLLVSGAGVWRATDQGLFNLGQGTAYQPWLDWKDDSAGKVMVLVQAAILAANTHNTQPWLFRLSPNRLEILADFTRRLPANDPASRELYISLGAALENILLAARANGFKPNVSLMPDAKDAALVVRVELENGPAPAISEDLYRAIPDRHTNRYAYDTAKSITTRQLQDMQDLSNEPNVRLLWLNDRDKFSRLTLKATETMNSDRDQAIETHNWTRYSRSEIEKQRDGLTLETMGLSDQLVVLGKMLPPSTLEQDAQYYLQNTRDIQLATAANFGVLVVQDSSDRVQQIRAGQLWQRLQLWGTVAGLVMQPLDQLPVRADREQQLNLTPYFTNALQSLVPDPQWKVVLPFRVGYPTRPASASPRRVAKSVLVPVQSN